MDFYSFFNSSTSYRVRIALALKGIEPIFHGVNIRLGEHRDAHYVATVNPSAVVPAVVDGNFHLGQSLAIIDWLDGTYPEPRLIPAEPVLRARVLEFSNLIACDIHPVNNLRVLKYLTDVLKATSDQKDAWYKHWIAEGLCAAERLLEQAAAREGGPWCFGGAPTLADVCLVPQVANALRMGCDLSAYSRVMAAYRHASGHPSFVKAEPKNQPDYVA
ncbi:maleylacetoacetate isomerase [Paraburkholderia lycopersici]|uniref:Maleylacetoacetate isomerase n=1 Tax=Paraburkholderia lycopersici TaxID=416944 RepID=A0A1G6QYP4_9BURK|nr:maleylacetoacetate isomerase [Paraburkholderia lycopersici]SDC97452.1 maleylacetoacetate isomerase [Paraburkholderia lycopersici]